MSVKALPVAAAAVAVVAGAWLVLQAGGERDGARFAGPTTRENERRVSPASKRAQEIAPAAPPPPSASVPSRAPAFDTSARVLAPLPHSEADLMRDLRRLRTSDPARALDLARDGNRSYPNSADAPERASIIVHALADLDRPSEAREEAEQMVNEFPDSPYASEIEAFTGAHPRVDHELLDPSLER